jgi:hypothetical protein
MSVVIPTCPTDCTSVLPDVDFDYCAPDFNMGQISEIYIGNIDQGFTDWTSLAEWNSRISEDSSDVDALRRLYVIGDKPEPESNDIDMSKDRIVVGNKKHTLNFRIDETGATNYEFLRTLECGTKYNVWFVAGKYVYGGNDGIEANLKLNDIIPEDNQELNTFNGTVVWEAKFHPERTDNPMD